MKNGHSQRVGGDWATFPGGELQGRRPKTLCVACREAIGRAAAGHRPAERPRALCFDCYRAGIERERALKAAGELNTASVERFQDGLPFEPVNHARLQMLKAERAASRTTMYAGAGRFVDRRRQAQLAARHTLQRLAAGLHGARSAAGQDARAREMSAAIHAAELQLPEAWIPFVAAQ